jgi:hypothetical protein
MRNENRYAVLCGYDCKGEKENQISVLDFRLQWLNDTVLHHVFTAGTWSFSNAHTTFANASEPY